MVLGREGAEDFRSLSPRVRGKPRPPMVVGAFLSTDSVDNVVDIAMARSEWARAMDKSCVLVKLRPKLLPIWIAAKNAPPPLARHEIGPPCATASSNPPAPGARFFGIEGQPGEMAARYNIEPTLTAWVCAAGRGRRRHLDDPPLRLGAPLVAETRFPLLDDQRPLGDGVSEAGVPGHPSVAALLDSRGYAFCEWQRTDDKQSYCIHHRDLYPAPHPGGTDDGRTRDLPDCLETVRVSGYLGQLVCFRLGHPSLLVLSVAIVAGGTTGSVARL